MTPEATGIPPGSVIRVRSHLSSSLFEPPSLPSFRDDDNHLYHADSTLPVFSVVLKDFVHLLSLPQACESVSVFPHFLDKDMEAQPLRRGRI